MAQATIPCGLGALHSLESAQTTSSGRRSSSFSGLRSVCPFRKNGLENVSFVSHLRNNNNSGSGSSSSQRKFAEPPDGKPTSPFTQAESSKPTGPTNPFRKAPIVPADWEKAGARPAGSGKRVLDAFKEGEKEGNTTKFGQPVVPKNIFDEVRRTPEEIAADAFKFELSSGQLVLAASFLVVIAIMFGTVFLVWKVGAIHYNEY